MPLNLQQSFLKKGILYKGETGCTFESTRLIKALFLNTVQWWLAFMS